MHYEEAGIYRDKILSIETVLSKQKVVSTRLEDQDIIGYCRKRNQTMVQLLVVREGKMVGEKIYAMKSLDNNDDNETLSSFLKQYYSAEVILPKEILLPHPIGDFSMISNWLSQKKGRRVYLNVPSSKERVFILDRA